MAESDDRRAQLVQELIEYRRPPREVVKELSKFPWDADRPLGQVEVRDVCRLLGAFLHQGIPRDEVEAWADAIEVRDDLTFASETVKETVHRLSNPALHGPLDPNLAARSLRICWPQTFPVRTRSGVSVCL